MAFVQSPGPRAQSQTADGAMIATGFGAIIAGGLVAAVTEPLGLPQGSWLAAYLVLVAGAAQAAMGTDRRAAQRVAARSGPGWAQFWCWNAGNAAVITGTLASTPLIVGLGSLPLIVALVLAYVVGRESDTTTWKLWPAAYRGLLLMLAISIPIGIALSYLRIP